MANEVNEDHARDVLTALPSGRWALARIDAQAAVIERVLAWSNCESLIPYERYVKMREALAAEPEATAPGCCPFVRSGGFHGEDCNDLGRGPCGALAAAPKHTRSDCGHDGDKRDGHCFECATEAERAAAPEHTGPDVAAARLEYETRSVLESKLAAANARVAELERLHEQALSERDAAHLSLESMTAGRDSALELAADISDQRDAANARVTELEGELKIAWEEDPLVPDLRARVAELERENRGLLTANGALIEEQRAANARADAAERKVAGTCLECAARTDRAESEAAALRAAARYAASRLERAEQRETVLNIAAELRTL